MMHSLFGRGGRKMREIKFRIWNKEKKRMITKGVFKILDAIENGKLDRDKFEILQYTGLKDCDGKEIYEGDIIMVDIDTIPPYFNKGIIVYHPPSFYLESKDGVIDYLIFLLEHSDPPEKALKVIGNIYENPKLLEDKNV